MTAIRMLEGRPYPTYLIELLQSSSMRGEIERLTDVGTILNALNVRNIPLLRCVLPTADVFQAFELVCRPLRASMEANMKRATLLADVRDTLLPRLISGRLRLSEPAELMKNAA
jgi:type I restriction enzyme S subunit